MKKNKINYSPFNCPLSGITSIQGIRGVDDSPNVYVSGTLTDISNGTAVGLIYDGPLTCNGSLGTWYQYSFTSPDFDDVFNTSCYGPNNLEDGEIQFVGSYKRTSTGQNALGMLYEGPLDGSGTYTTISPDEGNTKNVYVHSVMGGFAVGNYDTELFNGFSFIYDIENETFNYVNLPDSYSTTLYGIWHNGGTSYTICGGHLNIGVKQISKAFLADYNSETNEVTNVKDYQGQNEPLDTTLTHFEGITVGGKNSYNLAAGFANTENGGGAAFAKIKRNSDGTFGEAEWVTLAYPSSDVKMSTSDTVYKNKILGITVGNSGSFSYLAEILFKKKKSFLCKLFSCFK